jgi:tetratricopeptide (TPR) repeat protein
LLRQYAQTRLEEKPQAYLAAQNAHAAYFATFMQQMWDDLKGKKQRQALAKIEADIENVRAAWSYNLERKNASQIWMFSKALWQVYWIRWWNHAGMELFGEAVRALDGEEEEQAIASRAQAMAFQGYFMAWLDLADQGHALTKDSVEILEKLEHPEALVLALDSLGVNAYMINRYSEEINASNKMLAIATELNDPWLLAFSLFAVSMGTLLLEDYPEAKRLAESNLNISEEIGDVIGSTLPLIVLGHASLALDEFHEAKGYYQRCLKISQQVGFPYAIQTASKYLGKVSLGMGEIAEAEYHLLHSLSITKEIGFIRDIINLFYEFARLRVAQGDPVVAAELLAFVIQHPASQESRMFEGRIRDSAKDLLAGLKGELNQEIYNTALDQGRNLELEEVVADLLDQKN